MDNHQDLQAQINTLKSELTALKAELTLITNLISRHGLADPRIRNQDFSILDRLHALDGK
jgi:prefoldin subunit 5